MSLRLAPFGLTIVASARPVADDMVESGGIAENSRRWASCSRLAAESRSTLRAIVLPRIAPDNVGLVTVWNERSAAIQFWRSVFERRAPQSLAAIEELMAPTKVGQGNTTRAITRELLKLLADAYREANAVQITSPT